MKYYISLCALVFTSFFVFCISISTVYAGPLDAIANAQKGIDTSDYALFSKGLDVDSVLNSTADLAVTIVKNQDPSDLGSQGAILLMLLDSMDNNPGKVAVVKTLLVSEGKDLARAAVQGGYLAGKPDPSKAGDAGMFGSLLKKMPKDRYQIVAGKVLEDKNSTVIVSATLKGKELGEVPLKLRIDNENGTWRIKELLNVQDIVKSAYM